MEGALVQTNFDCVNQINLDAGLVLQLLQRATVIPERSGVGLSSIPLEG